MKAPVFPIFSLKTYYNYVIVVGGGGNQDFGKKNGLVILDETTYNDIAYFETEDIILGLYISRGEISLEEDDLIGKEEDLSLESSIKDYSAVLNDFPLLFACRGTNFLYVCKFDGNSVTLVTKIDKVVSTVLFKEHMIFLANKKIFTIYDAIHKPKIFSRSNKGMGQNKSVLNDESHEEYIYALKKSGNKILVAREEGKTDVPDTWENFFVVGNRIHKVTAENRGYCFVFNGKRYFYENEIGEIACLEDETVVFYLKGVNSTLKFLGKCDISFEIPKITCMNVENGEFICIGTADGKGYLFKDCKLFCTKRLCDFPITGISFEKGYFYYSSFNGLVSRKKAFSLLRTVLLISFIAVLLLAVIIRLRIRKEDYKKGEDVY